MLVTLIAAASTAGAKLYLEQTHLPRQRRLCDIEHSRSRVKLPTSAIRTKYSSWRRSMI